MSYLDWKVGDRVVCIASAERIALMQSTRPGSNYPASKSVYTIREIRDDADLGGSLCVLLGEVSNAHLIGRPGYIREPGFPLHGFRKVHPRKTDISIFIAILHGQHDKVPA